MKINRTAKSESAASEILDALQNVNDEDMGWRDRVIAVNASGDLIHYNAACGADEGETVLIERFECDSMGDGWESATSADVIEWIETNCD